MGGLKPPVPPLQSLSVDGPPYHYHYRLEAAVCCEQSAGSGFSSVGTQDALRRRRVRGAAIIRPEKSLLDLYRDLIQPFFRAVGPVLVKPDIGLKVSDTIFRGAKLRRKLLRDVECMLAVFFRDAGGLMEQVQNAPSGVVQWIGCILTRGLRVGSKRYDKFF